MKIYQVFVFAEDNGMPSSPTLLKTYDNFESAKEFIVRNNLDNNFFDCPDYNLNGKPDGTTPIIDCGKIIYASMIVLNSSRTENWLICNIVEVEISEKDDYKLTFQKPYGNYPIQNIEKYRNSQERIIFLKDLLRHFKGKKEEELIIEEIARIETFLLLFN